jgi:hypothetical protein
MSEDKQTTIIEINGVKLEVDLRTARRIDTLHVGDRVKCLVKSYSSMKTLPGIVVGFDPFPSLPTIVVAYIDDGYMSDALKFQSFNAGTKDFEVVADLDNNPLQCEKANVVARFDRDITKKQHEVEELEAQKQFFIDHFGRYFGQGDA